MFWQTKEMIRAGGVNWPADCDGDLKRVQAGKCCSLFHHQMSSKQYHDRAIYVLAAALAVFDNLGHCTVTAPASCSLRAR
jgi:hypothetical protein